MKKTLVALAALAATAAFAQSSVGIVGVFDIGFKGNSSPNTGSTTTSTNAVAQNGTATSALKFIGTEDLGGGMKAGFLAEINPNLVQSSTSNQNYAFASDYSGTPFNGEQFLSLSGGFGEFKLGVPNAGFFLAQNVSHPMGTAMASGYGASGVNRLGSVAPGVVSGLNSGTSRIIRHERSLQYVTPTINGFSAMITYAAQNDNSTAANGNQDGYQDISLRYSNGPLNAAFSSATIKQGNGSVASLSSIPYAGAITATSATTATGSPLVYTTTTTVASGKATSLTGLANGDYTHSVLAANYNMGATTIYGGYTTSKSNGSASAEDATSYNVATKYTMGAIDFLGNYMVLSSNITNNGKVYGGGLDYNLSKRTAVYYRFELADANTDGKVATAGGSVTNANMVGVRHAF